MELKEKRYFNDIKIGESVFSLVFGWGEVILLLNPEAQLEGFFAFAAEFKKGNTVYYTLDGIPNWCPKYGCKQTLFYPKDIDFSSLNFEESELDIPKEEKIKKYIKKNKLEIRCPSGIWRHITDCPDNIVLDVLKKAKYYLLRKAK